MFLYTNFFANCVGQILISDKLSINILFISSGKVLSPLRTPDSICTIGISRLFAARAPANEDVVSP